MANAYFIDDQAKINIDGITEETKWWLHWMFEIQINRQIRYKLPTAFEQVQMSSLMSTGYTFGPL